MVVETVGKLAPEQRRLLRPATGRKAPAPPSVPVISIVVPCYNEESCIESYLLAVGEIIQDINCTFEFLFINDGSNDRTLDRLLAAATEDERIRIVNLSRNFGKEAALTAGIEHAAGDAIIVMDVDLQDPPELIRQFILHWRQGYDIVYGQRVDRLSDSPAKRLTAGGFYRFFNKISSTPIPANVGDYRLIDRRVVDALKTLPERNRFMKGLFAWVGFSQVGIPFSRAARSGGFTTFNYWKLWNFALDGVIGFSTLPLRVWTYVGLTVAFVSLSYGGYIAVRTMATGIDVPGYASIFTAILFFGGLQLITLGVIGEYLGRLFTEVKQRPVYLVENIYGQHDHQQSTRSPNPETRKIWPRGNPGNLHPHGHSPETVT